MLKLGLICRESIAISDSLFESGVGQAIALYASPADWNPAYVFSSELIPQRAMKKYHSSKCSSNTVKCVMDSESNFHL